MGDLAGLLKAGRQGDRGIAGERRASGRTGGLDRAGQDQRQTGQRNLPEDVETGEAPEVIMEREGLESISDEGALGKIIDEVIAANPKQVEQYRSGKQQVIGFLVGQVMKASRGQADPAAVNRMLKEKLG